jgi:single stranded DNA-binding protein
MSYIEAAVMGRLAGEVTHRHTSEGKPYVTFTVAVAAKGSDETEWVNAAAFEDVAAQMPPGAIRGERIYIEGKARVNRWTTKEGQPRANLQITASRLMVLNRIGRRKPKVERTSRPRQPRSNDQPGASYEH